jgi:hypothetical protein
LRWHSNHDRLEMAVLAAAEGDGGKSSGLTGAWTGVGDAAR